jgi:hypothetical protein
VQWGLVGLRCSGQIPQKSEQAQLLQLQPQPHEPDFAGTAVAQRTDGRIARLGRKGDEDENFIAFQHEAVCSVSRSAGCQRARENDAWASTASLNDSAEHVEVSEAEQMVDYWQTSMRCTCIGFDTELDSLKSISFARGI